MLPNIPPEYRGVLTACLFFDAAYYPDVRDAFKHFKLKVKDIETFYWLMQAQAISVGGQTPSGTRKPFQLTPAARYALLMSVTKEELEEADCISLIQDSRFHVPEREKLTEFLNAFIAIRDGADDVSVPYSTDSYRDRRLRNDSLYDVIGILRHSPEPEKYLRLVCPGDLAEYVEGVCSFDPCGADPFANVGRIQSVLRANGSQADLEIHDLLEVRCVFMQQGHPEARLQNMHPQTAFFEVMQGILALTQRRHVDAYNHLQEALRRLPGKHTVFPGPFENYLLGAAFRGAQSDPAVRKQAAALYKKIQFSHDDHTIPLRLFLCEVLNEDLEDEAEHSVYVPLETPFLSTMALITVRALSIKTEESDQLLRDVSECTKAVPLLALELSAASDPASDTVRQLGSRLGITSVLPMRGEEPDWQIKLDRIISLQAEAYEQYLQKQKESSKSEESCLCYLLDRKTLNVELRIRKTRDGVHFSKGRTVSLRSFENSKVPEASFLDISVPMFIRQEIQADGTSRKVFRGPQAVYALRNHPYVFDASDPDRRISIRSRRLRITAVREEDGSFRICSNAPAADVAAGLPLYLLDTEDGGIDVITASDNELFVLQNFCSTEEGTRLPPEAGERLEKALRMLSVNTEIAADWIGLRPDSVSKS